MIDNPAITPGLFGLFCILQALDFYTTYVIVEKQGGKEVGPVMKYLADAIDIVPALVLSKLGILVLVFSLAMEDWALIVLCVWYAYVVQHNFRQLKRPA